VRPEEGVLNRDFLDPLEVAPALEGFPLPVFVVGTDGVTAWQNNAARELLGDLRGVHYSDAVSKDALEGASNRFAGVMAGRTVPRARSVLKRPNGQHVRVEVTSAPIRRDGRIVGAFGIAIPVAPELSPPPGSIRLTPRQRDVLFLLVHGKTTREIADELKLSPATVRNYIAAMLRALGATSRLEAVLIALQEGIVSLARDGSSDNRP
jgi:DNA-binding CsgD family transcriptional regulator